MGKVVPSLVLVRGLLGGVFVVVWKRVLIPWRVIPLGVKYRVIRTET